MNWTKRAAGICLLALPLWLVGCGTAPGAASSSSTSANTAADFVTESDETESRRRARLRLELAAGYFQQGQTNVALDEIKQAIVIDPAFADAYNLRGLVYLRMNELPLAEDSFKRALALRPRDSDVAHNYGWLLCQQARYDESSRLFTQALSNPSYQGQGKTWMTQGLCQVKAGRQAEAERSLLRSYEIDAGNPLTAYNLALLLHDGGQSQRAQFYIRRLNNSELANAETLWLGIRIERKLGNQPAELQLADQLRRRFSQSRELAAYNRGAFNE